MTTHEFVLRMVDDPFFPTSCGRKQNGGLCGESFEHPIHTTQPDAGSPLDLAAIEKEWIRQVASGLTRAEAAETRIAELESSLAAAVAERKLWHDTAQKFAVDEVVKRHGADIIRRKKAESTLAAVRAKCNEMSNFCCDIAPSWADELLAILDGTTEQVTQAVEVDFPRSVFESIAGTATVDLADVRAVPGDAHDCPSDCGGECG